MLACKEEEAWQELVEGERRVRPILLLGNPPNVSYHVAEHLDVDSGVAAPREGHVELPLKNSTLFKALCISLDSYPQRAGLGQDVGEVEAEDLFPPLVEVVAKQVDQDGRRDLDHFIPERAAIRMVIKDCPDSGTMYLTCPTLVWGIPRLEGYQSR